MRIEVLFTTKGMVLLRLHLLFDKLETILEGAYLRRIVGAFLVFAFVTTLGIIEGKRQGVFPDFLANLVPGTSHLIAIDFVFGLLLIYEGIGLIIGLGRSVSEAVGKQIEIFSLILLRRSFKEFSHFGEPLEWSQEALGSVGHMLADAVGALLIFVLLALYYRILKHQRYVLDNQEQRGFIESKKVIALLLLAAYVCVGMVDAWLWVTQNEDRLIPFFEVFYTMLIFVDVLMVLISLQFSSTYPVAFRASGFAVATIFIRIALVAPPYFNAILGLIATLYTLGLTQAYNYFFFSKQTSVVELAQGEPAKPKPQVNDNKY